MPLKKTMAISAFTHSPGGLGVVHFRDDVIALEGCARVSGGGGHSHHQPHQ